jgi:hydroxypyruvate reductase
MNRDLRSDGLAIGQAALHAVDPGQAVRRFLRWEAAGPASLRLGEARWDLRQVDRVLLIAVGKAAATMAAAAAQILGSRLTGGLVVTKDGHAAGVALPPQVHIHETGHPVPDARGLAASAAVEALLASATARDRVLVLVSGGASALLPAPVPPLTLDELQAMTTLLLRAGATVNELNTVRKHVDRLKGGQMARAAQPAPVAALVLSDVVGDPLNVIASGPTVPDPTTFATAWAVMEHYRLVDQLPPAIAEHLRAGARGGRPDTPKPGEALFANVHTSLVGSNRLAALAAVEAARQLGYQALLLTTFVEGEAREVGKVAAALAKGMRFHGDPLPPPACLVWGGETTVTVRGQGQGGRNQELALAAALALEGVPDVLVMALATDGTDGPTEAAGGLVDGDTVRSARAQGWEAETALQANDSYHLLDAVDALIRTGPTGTNVNDLLVVLADDGAGPQPPAESEAAAADGPTSAVEQ